MNLEGELLSMSFNQNASCIAVGTRSGYRIFNCQPFGRNIFSTEGGIGTVKMLFCTSLVCLVGAGEDPAFSPRRLKLWNTKTHSAICELNFPSNVLNVELNHKRLVVALEDKIHIYDLQTMVNLQTLETLNTTQLARDRKLLNLSSLCALSPDHERNCYLALPANRAVGDVLLYDALNLVNFNIIHAHKTLLTAMAFSLSGKMLATASETGTVIRVFSVPTGEKLHVFRRGSYTATVYSLAFDETASMMAVSSNTGTIHVFNLSGKTEDQQQRSEEPSNTAQASGTGAAATPQNESQAKRSLLSVASGALNSMDSLFGRRKMVADMLPDAISDIVEPSRSFASAKVGGNKKVATLCALSDGFLRVVSSEGRYYQYFVQRGECQLVLEMPLYGETQAAKDQESGYTQLFKYHEEISEQDNNNQFKA